MDIQVSITPSDIARSLNEEIKPLKAKVLQFLADQAPDEMGAVMLESVPSGKNAPGGGKRSAYGQPPAIETRELLTSLQGRVASENTVEVSMAGHARYLDPVFDGYLNRPFIEAGVIRALNKLPQAYE
jgi:hypothetical protein